MTVPPFVCFLLWFFFPYLCSDTYIMNILYNTFDVSCIFLFSISSLLLFFNCIFALPGPAFGSFTIARLVLFPFFKTALNSVKKKNGARVLFQEWVGALLLSGHQQKYWVFLSGVLSLPPFSLFSLYLFRFGVYMNKYNTYETRVEISWYWSWAGDWCLGVPT